MSVTYYLNDPNENKQADFLCFITIGLFLILMLLLILIF